MGSTILKRGALKLLTALARAGFTDDDLATLASQPDLSGLKDLSSGYAKIKHLPIIDCDADPSLVSVRDKVLEHCKGGKFPLDLEKIKLVPALELNDGDLSIGNLCNKIKDEPVLNANALDFFLANPDLIPRSWDGKEIIFPGTVYDSNGEPGVAYFYRDSFGKWHKHLRWFGNKLHSFFGIEYVAMLE